MAVTSVKEIHPGRGGNLDERGQRSYQRRFRVVVNDRYDDPVVVGNAPGIPRLGNPYLTARGRDDGSVVKAVVPTPDDNNPYLWFVDVEYGALAMDLAQTGADGTTHTPGTGSGTGGTPDTVQGQNPTDNLPEIELDYVHFTRPIQKTITGQSIVNTAGDAFDPPPEVDAERLVLRITRNELEASMNLHRTFRNKLNVYAFAGEPPLTWKMRPLRARFIGFWNGIACYRTTYEFENREEGWKLNVWSRGHRERVGGLPFLITDFYGAILPEPIFLKADGTKANTEAEAADLEFTIYNAADYRELNLPVDGGFFPGARFPDNWRIPPNGRLHLPVPGAEGTT
jgi:hypothetical protein